MRETRVDVVLSAESTREAPPLAESVFLSESWLEACLATWPRWAHFDRIDVEPVGRPRAFALVGRATEVRHGILNVNVAALNESAHPGLDQATIEQNGIFACRSEDFDVTFAALLERIDADARWDELRFCGLVRARAAKVEEIATARGLRTRVFKERPTYWVDLDLVRSRHDRFVESLSGNLRQQLRRARRAIEADLGCLEIVTPQSSDTAVAWLDEMAPLHRKRWSGVADGSGFDNPLFVEFHRQLIRSGFARGATDLLRIDAGGQPIAYLYNLRNAGRVSFYLSAIDYQRSGRHKPGLLAHWLAIERSMLRGDHAYDFLAGESRYKAGFSTHRDALVDLILWRPRPSLRLENALRRMRRRIKTWSGARVSGLAEGAAAPVPRCAAVPDARLTMVA